MRKYIITLRLEWNNIGDPTDPSKEIVQGWGIKITGLRPEDRIPFRADFKDHKMVEKGRGSIVDIYITPRQATYLGSDDGAEITDPPMDYVTDLLEGWEMQDMKLQAPTP